MSELPNSDAPSVPQALGRLRIALNESFSRASRAEGLTPQQAELLCWSFQPHSISELAELMRCERSNVSHLVNRAAARHLLTRSADSEDARVSRVRLTDQGQRVATQFIHRLESLTAPMRSEWSTEQSVAPSVLLTEIAESLESQPHES